MVDKSASLSQAELDALLGDAEGEEESSQASSTPAQASMGLDQDSLDTLVSSLGQEEESKVVTSPQYKKDELNKAIAGERLENIDLLMDVMLQLTVELGRSEMPIKDVLELQEGSIIQLDKNVGDDMDILINERLFARGRLVAIGNCFGIQITQIVEPLNIYPE